MNPPDPIKRYAIGPIIALPLFRIDAVAPGMQWHGVSRIGMLVYQRVFPPQNKQRHINRRRVPGIPTLSLSPSLSICCFRPAIKSINRSIMRPASSSRIAALLLTLSPLALGGEPHDEISFSCMTLTSERTDPILSPGEVSSHTHLVAGGSGFQRTMEKDTAKNANATTCGVDIDRSNYWIPQLYHQMHNGHFEIVETESAVGGTPPPSRGVELIESPSGSLLYEQSVQLYRQCDVL